MVLHDGHKIILNKRSNKSLTIQFPRKFFFSSSFLHSEVLFSFFELSKTLDSTSLNDVPNTNKIANSQKHFDSKRRRAFLWAERVKKFRANR